MEWIQIVAISENNCIGKDNQLLWHLTEDLQFFKKTTLGKPIVMGRKTFESIGRALPKRRNIVISRNPNYTAENIEVVNSITQASEILDNEPCVFIIGGAQLYQETLPLCNTVYITKVHKSFEGDAFYSKLDASKWQQEALSEVLSDAQSGLKFQFWKFTRVR